VGGLLHLVQRGGAWAGLVVPTSYLLNPAVTVRKRLQLSTVLGGVSSAVGIMLLSCLVAAPCSGARGEAYCVAELVKRNFTVVA